MRSLRTFHLPLAALLCAALLLVPTTASVAGPSKEFAAEGFTWSLPDGWAFSAVSPDDKKHGIVAKAECENASISAFIFVQASDLDVTGRVDDIKKAGGEGVGRVVKQAVKDTTLSGVKGKVVVKKIKPDGGGEGHFRTYVIHAGGKFYQLIVQAWHGSHVGQVEGLNGIRKGFRLAKGAGGDDADETFDEVDSGDDSDDSGDGSSDAGGDDSAGDDIDWPAKGPTREGRCVKLPHRNVEWTLEDGPVKWVGGIDDAKAESGRFMWAAGLVPRKKKEFEKDTPDNNRLILDMIMQKAPPGFKPSNFVTGSGAQNLIQKQWRTLTDIDTGKTRNKDDVKIGNARGAFVKFEGKHNGMHRVVMLFVVVLRGELYFFRGIGDGHTDVYRHLAPYVGNSLKGVKFPETKEDQRGPLAIPSVPDFASDRGDDKAKKKKYTLPGVTFEKPEGMAKVPAGGSMERELRWAGEMRSEDGESYLYFDISAWQLNIPNTPNTDPEDVINKRMEQWKAGAGDDALLSKKGKPPFFKKGSFGRGKGLTYRFTGSLDGVPFVEEAWVVKYKANLLRFRFQYGGPDAEKKMKKLIKSVKKGVKFKK